MSKSKVKYYCENNKKYIFECEKDESKSKDKTYKIEWGSEVIKELKKQGKWTKDKEEKEKFSETTSFRDQIKFIGEDKVDWNKVETLLEGEK